MSELKNNSVLIVGAGISGLILGHFLSEKGFSVVLLEKSAGVGGRVATRRGENGHWNHGIPWLDKSEILSSVWNIWSKVLVEVTTPQGVRFVSPEGLTQVAKLL
ncbi:MAG: FAD-dependent oxidoreductase, partial [Pseudomonadota bacterium]